MTGRRRNMKSNARASDIPTARIISPTELSINSYPNDVCSKQHQTKNSIDKYHRKYLRKFLSTTSPSPPPSLSLPTRVYRHQCTATRGSRVVRRSCVGADGDRRYVHLN